MAKPYMLTVDDDVAVLRGIERDLRNKYGSNYRILRAERGATALESLQQIKDRNEDVALILADQRMPEMDGVQFLAKAREIHPDARRVLLTAYADTNAAIAAINDVKLHHYLMKPWDPPETHLYPILDDLLADWLAIYEPPFRGTKVIGQRWSADAHRVKDFLGRHQVPFKWIDAAEASKDPSLTEILDKHKKLPLIVFQDNTCEECPASETLAERLGLHTKASTQFYDLLIVGGGPAGLAAAVYGASEGLSTLMVDRDAPGGQAGLSSRIENYLGFPAGLSGGDLARRAVAQARKFGVEIISPTEAKSLRVEGQYRFITMADGSEISGSAVLLCTGLAWRKLDIPNIQKFTGAGVYYGAATTEGPSCQDEEVYVVGGANSAGQAAMHFSSLAKKIYMLVRGDGLSSTMSKYLIDQIEATPNIEVLRFTEVVGVAGTDHLEEITMLNRQTNETRSVPAKLLFVFIGALPETNWLKGTLCLDDHGFVRTGPSLKKDGQLPQRWPLQRDPYLLETSIPGVFAAGDTRSGSVKRVASGVGEGSVVVQFVHHYLGAGAA